MTVALSALPQFFDSAGNPLSGGKVFSYAAGTLTPLSTYTDRGGLTANANPVVLDSAGRADIWLSTNIAYKLIVQDSAGNVMDSVDQFYAGADPNQLVVAGIVPSAGGTYTGPVSFTGGVTFNGSVAQDFQTLDSLSLGGAQIANLWANSDFNIWQRAAVTSVADGAYGFDRVVNLCESGSATLSQIPTSVSTAMRITQPDAAPKRIGFCQIVETRDFLPYRGANISFALSVRCSTSVIVHCALVSWTSSQDAMPRDPINNWASTNYSPGNFFITNTEVVAQTGTLIPANTFTEISVSSVSPGGVPVSGTANNLYMVVWVESALPQNAMLDAAFARCSRGGQPAYFIAPNAQQELARCQRYYEIGLGSLSSYTTSGQSVWYQMPFKVTKRVVPALTSTSSVATNVSTFDARNPTVDGLQWFCTCTTTGVVVWQGTYTAYAELGV